MSSRQRFVGGAMPHTDPAASSLPLAPSSSSARDGGGGGGVDGGDVHSSVVRGPSPAPPAAPRCPSLSVALPSLSAEASQEVHGGQRRLSLSQSRTSELTPTPVAGTAPGGDGYSRNSNSTPTAAASRAGADARLTLPVMEVRRGWCPPQSTEQGDGAVRREEVQNGNRTRTAAAAAAAAAAPPAPPPQVRPAAAQQPASEGSWEDGEHEAEVPPARVPRHPRQRPVQNAGEAVEMRAVGAGRAGGVPREGPQGGQVPGTRVATAEECRVRRLYHNRPRLRLQERPLMVTCIVMDQPWWTQSLCPLPLFVPCMRNPFAAASANTAARKQCQSEMSNPMSPSAVCSNAVCNTAVGVEDALLDPPAAAAAAAAAGPLGEGVHPLQPNAGVYYLPRPSARLGGRQGADDVSRNAAPHTTTLEDSTTVVRLFDGAAALNSAAEGPRDKPSATLSMFWHNCRHLLYRCFCVRCALAAQAEALQADTVMRGAAPRPFPCCACLGLESRPYKTLLGMVCLLDALTLGVPCGCCCYHGFGTALYGWHLRYLLRARYRIFSCTALDFLIMCCMPGLAVDQQGVELAVNGMPERVVNLQFMT